MFCSEDNCLLEVDCKGFCQKHYQRALREGRLTSERQTVRGENRTKHPLYKAYHGMLDRCRNPNNTHYSYYGGRGITVCERWQGLQGFSNFISDVGGRPFGYTLDRIDNDKGYSPDNCQWATRRGQQLNQRLSIKNKSGFKGVSLYSNGKWTAQVYEKRVKKHLGYFNTPEEAARARDKYLKQTLL